MSWTQTGAPLAPLSHRTSLLFSYLLPPFPRSLPDVPILPVLSGVSVPPPTNCCQWTTTFFSRYRNKDTAVRNVPYAKKTLHVCSFVSSTTNLCHFLFVLLRHIDEVGFTQLRASCGKNMPHWGHRGWG